MVYATRSLFAALISAVSMVTALYSPTAAAADSFPDKLIRIIVPIAAGGGSDIVARILAEKIRVSLGQAILVEARPGANGNVATTYVLSLPADGYTIMVGHIGLMSVNSHVYNDITFDPLKDLTPIIWSVSYDIALAVHPGVPVKTVAELIAYAKANPKALMYASAGYGTSLHMAMEMFNFQAGIHIEHVPYKGTAPALFDMLAGRVAVGFIEPLTASPYLKAGKLRALGVANSQRSFILPDVPTMAESGFANFSVQGWNGMVAKAGTPRDRIDLLNQHLNMALKSPEVIKALTDNGVVVKGGTPEEFGNWIRSEYRRWGDVVQKAKLPKI